MRGAARHKKGKGKGEKTETYKQYRQNVSKTVELGRIRLRCMLREMNGLEEHTQRKEERKRERTELTTQRTRAYVKAGVGKEWASMILSAESRE